MTALSARDGYRLWAPTYAAETAISFLDEQLAREMLAGLPQKKLLDAGCGTGRRIAGMTDAVGIDASPEMVAAGGDSNLMVADIRALPFASARFAMTWCRLVLGHLADPLPAYQDLARVCEPGGYLFVTDFHPNAVTAGARRSFRDGNGVVHEVEHHVHADHPGLAAQTGFTLIERRDAGVGAAIRDFYERAGKLDVYEKDQGLKLVMAFLFRRAP
ncbi:MAG TPA: methyltransferase domain-containing protein [Rhizomicrobium sp.]|jgi:malonyl-CoA O-methyltransferase|nr:methyltransferase domain-containing protein [Rhizomicrobium sp.]